MRAANAETNVRGLDELAGRYLTFVLGSESYGIPVLVVREIIRSGDVTPVPRMPAYIKGVVNLRGRMLPVMDLRARFGLAKAGSNERTCTIVVQARHPNGVSAQLGLIVDVVEEVVQIAAECIEPPPDFGGRLNTDYILGIAQIKGGVRMLLDIDKLVAAEAGEKIEMTT